MSYVDKGGPAFPQLGGDTYLAEGMMLRDWFAGQALVGLLAGGLNFLEAFNRLAEERGAPSRDLYAESAYRLADAMLAERSKP